MLKVIVISFFLIFVNLTHSQIHIDDVGDNWKLNVEKSLMLIKQTDPEKYDTLLKYCERITFWNGTFSTIENSNTIMISQMDIKSNLINNISCVIVHESYHLKMFNVTNNDFCEERDAYKYEIEFIRKLNNPENWLLLHALKMLRYFEGECKL